MAQTRPIVYLLTRAAQADLPDDDLGWWFQCCPCPTQESGGVDEGPFGTASIANDAALRHLETHEAKEEA